MITQRQIQHPPGTLPRCGCGKAPRHFLDGRAARAGGGDFIECPPCGQRTARHPQLSGAVAEFQRISGNAPEVQPPANGAVLRYLQRGKP